MSDNELRHDSEMEESPTSDRASDPLGGLLKNALREPPEPGRSFLPKIQERIRMRTRGRYFRDRWSVARDPVSLLLMVALLILILAAAVFLVMQPLMSAPQEIEQPTPAVDPLAIEEPGRVVAPSSETGEK
jgi:hypothetical protein